MNIIILFATKIFLTAFVIMLVPIYLKTYGAQNFLWLSDVALFLTVLALWIDMRIIINAMIIAILPVEILWNIDYFFQLISRKKLLGIADYMFDTKLSFFVRSLSLFHIFLPLIWIWCLFYWGYDDKAWLVSIPIIWFVLLITYFFTDPKENINWVFMPKSYHWNISPIIWLLFLLIGWVVFIVMPMHSLLNYLFQ